MRFNSGGWCPRLENSADKIQKYEYLDLYGKGQPIVIVAC
jgi:hypothetical protein